MTSDSFTQLLGDLGAKADGHTHVMPEGCEVTFLVALEGETLTVTRVVKVTLRGTMALASCARGERYGFAIEDVRAVTARG